MACPAPPPVQEPTAPTTKVERDPAYEGQEQIFARRIRLSTSLERGPSSSFARLSPPQQQLLRSLTSRPDWQLTVTEAAGRMLITFPPSHPLANLELLLAHDLDQLVLYTPTRKLRQVMPLHRLPDVLDGVPLSHRGDFELDLKDVPFTPEHRLRRAASLHTALEAQVSLRYIPAANRPTSWPIRLSFRVESPFRITPPAQIHPLFPLALPLLQSWRGSGVLETITMACGTPSGWSLTVTNENKASRIPLTLNTRVHELGYVKIPIGLLSAVRPGYQKTGQTTLPRLGVGHQINYAKNLLGLRTGKASGALTVKNPTSSLALIYADGVLLGWVGPTSEMSFANLPAGFFRIFAISPTGLRSWGPLDSHIPGPLTLR